MPLARTPPASSHEVVDVVLAAGRAQRRAEDVVALQLARRVEQVRGQHLDAQLGALLVGQLVEVQLGRRLAGVEPALDAVEPGRQHDGGGQVRVAGAVDRAVLDAPGAGTRSICVRLL